MLYYVLAGCCKVTKLSIGNEPICWYVIYWLGVVRSLHYVYVSCVGWALQGHNVYAYLDFMLSVVDHITW